MSLQTTREQRRQLRRYSAKFTEELKVIPHALWAGDFEEGDHSPARVWRSRSFFVMEYDDGAPGALVRLSVLRTEMDGDRWKDGITWDDLQRIKRECGYGDRDAVEVYPADRDVVNVANLRHLWVLTSALPFKWSRPR